MKKKLLCLFLVLTSLCSTVLFAQQNLIHNGDFEDIDGALPRFWRADSWQSGPENTLFTIGHENPYSGTNYMVIENLTSNDARIMQTILVEPMSFYKISCQIRAKADASAKIGANVGIFESDFQQGSPSLMNTGGQWQYSELIVKTAEHTKAITVCARLGGFSNDLKGRAEFDDFRVEKLINAGSSEVKTMPALPLSVEQSGAESDGRISSTGGTLIIILLGIGILILVAVILVQKLKWKRVEKKEPSEAGEQTLETPLLTHKRRYTYLDYILCGALTLAYAIVAFTNLGSFKAPQTHWWPGTSGESFTADLGSVQTIRRFYYFEGLPSGYDQGIFSLEYSEDGETWQPYQSYTIGSIFYWYYDRVNIRARYIKIIAQNANFQIKEMVFFGEDPDKPLEVKQVLAPEQSPRTKGSPANVFDEPQTVAYRSTMLYGMPTGFDELYHARTAYEFMVKAGPYETTHPPLGKVIISLGISLFGMNPFGWRFMGTLVGVIMVILMYMLGKQLFKKTEIAFFCAFLMAFDFMHFVQTRIATIDSYGVFFIILMYYFMFQYFSMDFYKVEFKKTLLPLLFSGICWGLGAASKWIVIYAALGLAVLFFVTLARRISDYNYYARRLKSTKYKKDTAERANLWAVQARFKNEIWLTIGWCVVVFVVIPIVIYVAAYLPVLEARGHSFSLKEIWSEQTGMYTYHSESVKKETHPFSSTWYEWPVMWKPMWYHQGQDLPVGKTENLIALGNPAVWWVGSLAALGLIVVAIYSLIQRISRGLEEAAPKQPFTFRKFVTQITTKDRVRFFILVGFASQYLPWIISPRKLTFIYHFFASVPFIILALAYLVMEGKEKVKKYGKNGVLAGNFVLYFYLALVVFLFILFYPVLSYSIVDISYMKLLKWLPQWPM